MSLPDSGKNKQAVDAIVARLRELIDEAENKPNFHGDVALEATFRRNELVHFRVNLTETVKIK